MQIVIAALFLVHRAQAEPSDLPRKVERLSRQVKTMNGPQTCDGCGFPAGQDVATGAWKECLNEVCGASWNEWNSELMVRLSPANMKPTADKFSQLIDDAIQSEGEYEDAVLTFALKEFNSKYRLSEPKAKWAGHLTQALNRQNLIVLDHDQHVDVEETSKRFSNAKLEPEDRDMAVLAFNAWTASERTLPELFAQDFATLGSWDKERLQAEIEQALQYIDETAAKTNQSLGTTLDQLNPTPAERQLLRNQFHAETPSAQLIKRLAQVYRHVHGLNSVVSSTEFKRMAEKSELKAVPRAQLEKRLKALRNDLSPGPRDLTAGIEMLLAKNNCLVPLTLSQLLPQPSDIKRFKNFEEPNLRKKFLNHVRGFLSRHSAGKLENLARAQLQPAPSPQQYLEQMKAGLEKFTRENRALAEILRHNKGTPADLAVSLALASVPTFTGQKTQRFCKTNWPNIDDDRAFLGKNELHLSGRTAGGGPTGLFAASHEYAHLVSHVLQSDPDISSETKSWFEGIRSCLKQAVDQPSGKQIEEIFADLLGSSFAGGATRMFCGSIPKEERFLTLKNWNPNDPDHPGHLFRALHARVVRGEGIPEICRAALAEKGETPFDRNCLKEVPEAMSASRRR